MNIKILMQALKFACLPTLSILVLLFFGFFSITETFAFISSNSGWAIALRVAIVLAEGALVWYMYDHYLKIETEKIYREARIKTKEDLKSEAVKSRDTSGWREVKDLFPTTRGTVTYRQYDTESENIIFIERVTDKQD